MTDETTSEQLAEIEGQAEPVQVREGRWKTRGGDIRNVTPTPEGDARKQWYPWWDAQWHGTWTANGQYQLGAESTHDLIEYLGPIEPDKPQPEPQPESDTELQAQVAFLKGREVTLATRLQQEKEVTTRLRHELKTVQNQLAAVKSELASVAADRYRLQVELDAAQQVPADSPELRQLRADLAEVTRERDQYLDSYQRIFGDLETIRQTTKAAAVEAIAEWLEPVQAAIAAPDNVDESTRAGWFAEEVIQHLPSIMRSLTGLDSPEDVD